MQFTTLVAAAAALAASTNAAAIRRDGARLAQFRIFGAEGCHDLNYGFYTVDESDIGSCHDITDQPSPATSLNVEYLNLPVADGCTVKIFTDGACSEGERATSLNVCNNLKSDEKSWKSWTIECSTPEAE